jgi:hypothetical protein
MSRWRIGALVAALAAGAVVITSSAVTTGPTTAAANGSGIKQFGVSDVPGRATALIPGATGNRWIRLTNVENFPILVQTLTTTVGSPVDSAGHTVPACPANAVRVDALAKPVTVAGNGIADVALVTHMVATASNSCRNLTFPLTYNGTATKP